MHRNIGSRSMDIYEVCKIIGSSCKEDYSELCVIIFSLRSKYARSMSYESKSLLFFRESFWKKVITKLKIIFFATKCPSS